MSKTNWKFLAITFLLFHRAIAHYNLKDPMPYNAIDCNPPGCPGPCPRIWKSGNGRAQNSPKTPSRVWRRGEVVKIEWQRNNHEGGFYRRSLVPVHYMFSHYWHAKTAFEYGCWSQGRFKCGRSGELEPCGTDLRGFAYQNNMTVPNMFPDGDYVFAMVWYGGLHWRLKKADFANYFTCSFVRVAGGSLYKSHIPKFVPGKSIVNREAGKCLTSSTFVGECNWEKCLENKVESTKPREFQDGRTPAPLLLKDLTIAMYNTSSFRMRYHDSIVGKRKRSVRHPQPSSNTVYYKAVVSYKQQLACETYCKFIQPKRMNCKKGILVSSLCDRC